MDLEHETKDFGAYSGDDRAELAIKDVSESGTFTGYASVFNRKDLEDEIVESGAFAKSIQEAGGRFPLLWQHNRAEVLGVVEGAKEDLKGLHVTGKLSMGVQRSKDAYALMKDGVIRAMSIGFKTVRDSWEKATGARHLKELRLHEVSLVTFPANPHALVTSVKAVTSYKSLPIAEFPDRAWDSKAAIHRVASWAESAESQEEKRHRMEAAHVLRATAGSGPRLLIADIFGDELKVDPRALDEVTASVLGGAFSAKDSAAVLEHIEKYYMRLGIVAPWRAQESLSGIMATATRLAPHAPEEERKALVAALGGEVKEPPPFDWIFQDLPKDGGLRDLIEVMRPD